ncbi:MAG TPA: hypothetical protein VEX18_18785 [Polyangiaceae bacterium]|nr:hypothetical protein [Polyangiaceae bacterium]
MIEPHAAPSCVTVPGSVSDDSCWTELACTVPATIEGFDVVASTRLGVACRRAAADGPWFCVCASSDATQPFELGEAGMLPAEARSSALPQCLELTPAPLGPRHELIPPLVSLPEP